MVARQVLTIYSVDSDEALRFSDKDEKGSPHSDEMAFLEIWPKDIRIKEHFAVEVGWV